MLNSDNAILLLHTHTHLLSLSLSLLEQCLSSGRRQHTIAQYFR